MRFIFDVELQREVLSNGFREEFLISGERAGSRTPMQWDDSLHAGFSTRKSDDIYLPLDPDPNRPTVKNQKENEFSLLMLVKKLLELRDQYPALGSRGKIEFISQHGEYPLVYLREFNGSRFLVAANPSAQSCEAGCPFFCSQSWELLNYGCEIRSGNEGVLLHMAPFGYLILSEKGASCDTHSSPFHADFRGIIGVHR